MDTTGAYPANYGDGADHSHHVENTQNTNHASFLNKTVNETQLVRLSLDTQEKFLYQSFNNQIKQQ